MWMCRAIGVGTRLPVERENKVQGGLAVWLTETPFRREFLPTLTPDVTVCSCACMRSGLTLELDRNGLKGTIP